MSAETEEAKSTAEEAVQKTEEAAVQTGEANPAATAEDAAKKKIILPQKSGKSG